jgi:hypothetical protein
MVCPIGDDIPWQALTKDNRVVKSWVPQTWLLRDAKENSSLAANRPLRRRRSDTPHAVKADQ